MSQSQNKAKRKDVVVRVMVTPDEHQRIQNQAAKENRSVSSWMRLLALAQMDRK